MIHRGERAEKREKKETIVSASHLNNVQTAPDSFCTDKNLPFTHKTVISARVLIIIIITIIIIIIIIIIIK